MKKIISVLSFIFFCSAAFAETKVVTTTTVIFDLVKTIGKEKVKADYLVRGDQDPHFLEILPSYMLKLRNADLFIKIGLDLEKWAPQLIDGSRNNNIKIIDLSEGIQKKEVPTGKIDASQGDIHPYGNPHYWLDPENVKIMAEEIYKALSTEDVSNEKFYKQNLDLFLSKLSEKEKIWDNKMKNSQGEKIIFFHSSWVYFADRYHIRIAGYVEPKPGVPPTPSHNAEIINLMRKNNIQQIVMENYYNDSAPNQIANLTDAKVIKMPINVFGMQGINSYFDMMDYIIDQFSGNLGK